MINQLLDRLREVTARASQSGTIRVVATAMARLESNRISPLQELFSDSKSAGGAVPLSSKYYVMREADAEFRSAITRKDSVILVKGARQMGKTSLLARGLHHARNQGARVVLTNLQKLNAVNFESTGSFFQALAASVATRQIYATYLARHLL